MVQAHQRPSLSQQLVLLSRTSDFVVADMEVDMVADDMCTLFQLVLLGLIAHLRLQFDKLFRDFVGRPLAEDSQNRPPGLVHVHSATERKPTSARTLRRKNV